MGTVSDTVQEALEELFERLPLLGSWPRIAAAGISWRNDRTLPFTQFHVTLLPFVIVRAFGANL